MTERSPRETAPLSSDQVNQFNNTGIVLLKGVYTEQEIARALVDVETQVERCAQALKAWNKVPQDFAFAADASLDEKMCTLDAVYPGASTVLHKNPEPLRGIRALWQSPRILEIAEQILRTKNIAGHPVWNLRCKTPERLSKNHATVPWHQDHSYLDDTPALQLSAWIPLVPVRADLGPMEFVKGPWFKQRKLLKHEGCWENTWYLTVAGDDTEKQGEGLFCASDMELGDVLIFDNFIPHRSHPNRTESTVRWSLDLRWQDSQLPNGCNAPGVVLSDEENGSLGDLADWNVPFAQPVDWKTDEAVVNPLVGGPWMDRWEMTHENEHVRAYKSGAQRCKKRDLSPQ